MKKEDLGKTIKSKVKELIEADCKVTPKRIQGIMVANGWDVKIQTIRYYNCILRK